MEEAITESVDALALPEHPFDPRTCLVPPASLGSVQHTNTTAITAFVALFVCAPLALPIGMAARRQIRTSGQQGGLMALVAMVIGGFVTVVIGVELTRAFLDLGPPSTW